MIKYFVKNIIQAAKDIGCEVHLHTQKSDIESCSEVLYLEALKNFNPHITVNINHLNNIFLNDKVFNFVWFQDPMEILYDDTKINLRKRDFIFHLIDSLEKQLKVKNIDSKHQPFCLNDTVYKKRNDVKKEKKIVYVGGSYKTRIESHQDDIDFKIIYEEAKAIFEKKSYLKDLKHEDSEMEYLMKKYNKNLQYIGDIYAYLSRDYCVEKLCQIDTDYEIEIYGRGWENNNIVKPYFKGVVDYGEDISKIYNSATYGYCPGAYILMQRTLECAFSETIPLVLDVRADKSDGDYDKRLENGIEFFHIRDLENILRNSSPENKDFSFIKEQYNFKHFINECLNIVNSELAINRK